MVTEMVQVIVEVIKRKTYIGCMGQF